MNFIVADSKVHPRIRFINCNALMESKLLKARGNTRKGSNCCNFSISKNIMKNKVDRMTF